MDRAGKIWICGGAFLVNMTSENRRFVAGCFRGGRGYGFIRSEGPRRQMQDFERWVRGELRFSCDKFLLAKGDLSFGGEVFLVVCLFVCFCRLGKGFLWPGELPFRYIFKRCICWGPSGLSKPENSEAPFRKPFSTGVWVSEVTAEGLEKT